MSNVSKNIIFDIGNVLLEWQPEHVLRSVFSVADTDELLNKTFLSAEWKAYDQGMMTTKELKEQMAFNLGCSITAVEALLQNVVVALRPIPEMVELLHKLHGEGYHLYALTNMPSDIFHSLFEEHQFWHLFNDIAVSSHLKMAKPDPEIFEFVLNKHQLNAKDCIFLDDSKANIETANKIGFTTIKVMTPQQAVDDLNYLLATRQ